MGDPESGKPIRSPWRDWLTRIAGDSRLTAPAVPERRDGERRTHSFRSFTYGSFRPRRRIGRRDGDHDRIFLDWHEPRVLYLALAIVLMCCADALFTLNLMAVGAEEMNVLMGSLIASDVELFLAIKIGVREMPPLLFSGVRFMLAGSIMGAYVLLSGRGFPARADRASLAISAVLMLGVANSVLAWALMRVPSGIASSSSL